MRAWVLGLLGIGIGGVLIATSAKKASAQTKPAGPTPTGPLPPVPTPTSDVPSFPTPPTPTEQRALVTCAYSQFDWNSFWIQTDWYQVGGASGFYYGGNDPPSLDFLGGASVLGNPQMALMTGDGAVWYYDNGWHPAPPLAAEYCSGGR